MNMRIMLTNILSKMINEHLLTRYLLTRPLRLDTSWIDEALEKRVIKLGQDLLAEKTPLADQRHMAECNSKLYQQPRAVKFELAATSEKQQNNSRRTSHIGRQMCITYTCTYYLCLSNWDRETARRGINHFATPQHNRFKCQLILPSVASYPGSISYAIVKQF